jgi:hypothetical protein
MLRVTHFKIEPGKKSLIGCEQAERRKVEYYLLLPLLPTPCHYGERTSFGSVYPHRVQCPVNARQIEVGDAPDWTLSSLYRFLPWRRRIRCSGWVAPTPPVPPSAPRFSGALKTEISRLLHVANENAGAFGVESSDSRAENADEDEQ